jgi:MinD superfamily P-loop ATPase
MRIAIASGKGGTGKTMVATNLAVTLAEDNIRVLDCDVEAPDAGLFLKPRFENRKHVGVMVPVVDMEGCTYCGKCAEACQFHAIAVFGKKVLVFPELCHGCGSCTLLCPSDAIKEELDTLGILENGMTQEGIDFVQGTLKIGAPMAVPVIRELKKWRPALQETVEIRDAPPGASCPVVETLRDADFAVLVTEPTPFGLHDLKQVAEIVRMMDIPAGVVLNRDGIGNGAVEAYCQEANIPILMRIPMDRRIAESLAAGGILIREFPEYHEGFLAMYQAIRATVMI